MKKQITSEFLQSVGIVHMGSGLGSKNTPWQIHDSEEVAEGKLQKLIDANDAQPAPLTSANSGIPTFMTTYVDPKVIEVQFAPLNAAEFAGGETKRGDWTDTQLVFKMSEKTGRVVAYGDRSNGGRSDVNLTFPSRQQFRYQTMLDYGTLEVEQAARAGVNLASEKQLSAARIMNTFRNNSYLFGVSGLQLYGLLNDPGLSPAITPTTKTGGGTSWAGAQVQPYEILNDFHLLFAQLQIQTQGLIKRTDKLRVAIDPISETYLTKSSNFNEPAIALIKKAFKNIEFVIIPQYATGSGNLLQMMAPEVQGQKTVECVFTEIMRAHPLIVETSAYHQKRSGGTGGAIYYAPMNSGQMLGI